MRLRFVPAQRATSRRQSLHSDGVDGKNGYRYTVRTFDDDSSLWTAEGWDPVTGIGTPNATYITSYAK